MHRPPASRSRLLAALAVVLALLASACGPVAEQAVPDRQPGERTPLSAMCDGTDPARCLLPFPSNVYTVADGSTRTGLRLALDSRAMPSRDEVGDLNLADGFSRLSPLLTAFPGALAAQSLPGAMRLLLAQPGTEEGTDVPLRVQAVQSTSSRTGEETLLVGFPLRPLAPAADHVVVVLDSLRTAGGQALVADRPTLLSLARVEPASDEERARIAYHAPTRALLERAGIQKERVLRLWDFTTRSAQNARARLEAARAQQLARVEGGEVGVAIDSVRIPAGGTVAAIVEGRLTGLLDFRTAEGRLALDEGGLPRPAGLHDAPFRVALPAGTGAYRVVLYGHGTGGSVQDGSFDERITSAGLAKVGGLFYGWDGSVMDTLLGLERVQLGVARSTAGLVQALADLSAIEHALAGVLGEALAAPTLKDVPNPAAGRRPDAAEPLWTGGSLGGTLGLVYSGLSPRVRYAVLNVPGAGWTHFIPGSDLFSLLSGSLQAGYASPLDFWLSLMASQGAWDDVDGGNWADDLEADGSVYLLQQSMGDPILPNPGSELCAAAVRAVQVGAVLSAVPGLSSASEVSGHSGLTQFAVPDGTSGLNRHGFAARSGPAGDAAREQISAFLDSALAGAPRIVTPALCQTNPVADSCDFSAWVP